MKLRLMDILICPECKGGLKLHPFSEETGESGIKEITDGILTCRCKRWYPIIGGIPRMLPDSLRDSQVEKRYSLFLTRYRSKLPKGIGAEKARKDTRLKRDTLESFGFQWNRFHEMFPEFRSNFLNYIKPIKPSYFKNKVTRYSTSISEAIKPSCRPSTSRDGLS